MTYKQSHPDPAARELIFHLTNSSTGAPLTGQTFATTDLQLRKPGASAYANCNSTQQSAVVEIGGGDYVYTFAQAELDTPGTGFAFKANKSGALLWTTTDEILRAYFGKAITGTLAANQFTTDRSESTDDLWKDALVTFLTGSLAGQVKKIGGYTGASKLIALTGGLSFTGAPSNGDIFEILTR